MRGDIASEPLASEPSPWRGGMRQERETISIVAGSLKAILDRKPGSRRSDLLLVVVDVEVAVACVVELVAAVPQGINPLIKLLRFRLDVAQPEPDAVIVRRTLRYEEATVADYKEVWLGAGDTAISAKVSLVM